jgi:DNA adenine methylase
MKGDSVGQGVHRATNWNTHPSYNRRPDLSNAHGVHLPSLGNDRGINGVAAAPCADWFRALQARLRHVRVACGDWKRVLGPSVLGKGKNVGGRRPCAVFLDPPYPHDARDPGLYSEDVAGIWEDVREWALAHGDDPDLRIALCGYEGEHEMPGWTCYAWKAARGYASADNVNRERERIWFSKFCNPINEPQLALFEEMRP